MKIIDKKDKNRTEEAVVYYDGTNLDEVNEFFGKPCVVKDGVIHAPLLFSLPISAGTIVCKDGMHVNIKDIDKWYKVVDASQSFIRDYTLFRIARKIDSELLNYYTTKDWLAKAAKVNKNSVSRICSGTDSYTLDNLINVLYTLGLKIEIVKDKSIDRFKGVEKRVFRNSKEAGECQRKEFAGLKYEFIGDLEMDVFDDVNVDNIIPASGYFEVVKIMDKYKNTIALIGYVAIEDQVVDNPKTNESMEKKFFKTRTEVDKYIETNYPGMNVVKIGAADVEFFDDWDDSIDNAGGEVSTIEIRDDDLKTLAYLGWWEEGDDVYEIFGNGKLLETCDNIFDARHAYDRAMDNFDDDKVVIKINGEEQDW